MSYHFDFDPTNRILRCLFKGDVTDDELKSYYQEASRYVRLTRAESAITDYTAVQNFDVSPATARELAALPPIMPEPDQVRCIVAPSDKVFGLGRLFELHGEATRANLHVVRTLKEALAILRVRDLKFRPIETD
jgi:hypothetical protein